MSDEEKFEEEAREEQELCEFGNVLWSALRAAGNVDVALGVTEAALHDITDALVGVGRKHWQADRLMRAGSWAGIDMTASGLNVEEAARLMLWTCEEFEKLRPVRKAIRFVWRLSKWGKSGRVVEGKAAKIPQRQRDLDPSAKYEITLSLPWWIAASEEQRLRTLHHELMHVRGWEIVDDGEHEIMEFAATLARFGPGDSLQARAIAAATMRPAWEAEVRRYGFDPVSGQGLLFATEYKAVEPRVPVPGNPESVTLQTAHGSVTITAERARKRL